MEDTTTEAPALLKVGNKKQEFKQTKLDQGRRIYDPKKGKAVWVPAIPLILVKDTTTEAPALLKVGNKKQEFKQTKLDQGRQVYDPKEGKAVWVPAIPLILVKDEEKGEGE